MDDQVGPSCPSPRLWIERFDGFGDREALHHRDGVWTHRELAAHIRTETRRLIRAGVGAGETVAVVAGNHPVGFALRWAVGAAGATLVLIPDGVPAAGAAELLDVCGAGALAAGPQHLELAMAIARQRPELRVLPCGHDAPESSGEALVVSVPPDVASLRLTGGSTGVPKAVPRAARPPGPTTDAEPPVQLLCTPAAHLAGTLAESVLARGGKVVLHDVFDPGEVWAALARHVVTMVWLQPRLLHELLDDPLSPVTAVPALRALLLGSAPSSPERLLEALERFGPIVAEGYGTLEATQISWLSAEEMQDPELRPTVGRVAPGVVIRIEDDAGREVGRDEIGRILVRGAGVMSGYLNDPAATARVLHNGWFDTGDLGRLDGRGYLTLVGRAGEMIDGRRGRVYPTEHERLLATHADVADAAVIPRRDAAGDVHVVAAVVARPGRLPDPVELVRFTDERRGLSEALDDVRVVAELPLTPSAKVDRRAVARLLDQGGPPATASSTAADQENPAPTPISR